MQIDSVRVTRDSLNRADELKAPHEEVVAVTGKTTVEELLADVYKKLKAANRAYESATWSITSRRPLAVVSDQWDTPRILLRSVRRIEDTVVVQDNTAYLHFCLHPGVDPDTLHQTLDRLSFPYLGATTT